MFDQFPALAIAPAEVTDPGTVRLGSGCITGQLPPRRRGVSRRNLLSTAALIPLGLAACSNLNTTTTAVTTAANQVASDAQTLGAALASILPAIQSVSGITSDTVAKVQGYITQVQAVAGQIATAVVSVASSASGGVANLVSSLGSNVTSLASSLGGFTLPSWVGTVITAAQAILPALFTAVGIALASAAAPAMTTEQARLVLRAAAVGKGV